MSKTIFISGHLDITPAEFDEHYVKQIEEVAHEGARFVVGDARGTDTFAQTLLANLGAKASVFHMFDRPRNNPHSLPTEGGFTSDDERDAAMTLASNGDIAWVRPGREKSGTARNLARRKTKA
jgi:hypothetical protein